MFQPVGSAGDADEVRVDAGVGVGAGVVVGAVGFGTVSAKRTWRPLGLFLTSLRRVRFEIGGRGLSGSIGGGSRTVLEAEAETAVLEAEAETAVLEAEAETAADISIATGSQDSSVWAESMLMCASRLPTEYTCQCRVSPLAFCQSWAGEFPGPKISKSTSPQTPKSPNPRTPKSPNPPSPRRWSSRRESLWDRVRCARASGTEFKAREPLGPTSGQVARLPLASVLQWHPEECVRPWPGSQ